MRLPIFGLFQSIVVVVFLSGPSCSTVSVSKGGLPLASKEQPFVNSLGMKFVPVPGTNILMCTTETTVAQYQAAGMGYQTPPFAQRSNHPAASLSWNDAKAWCAWLSKKEGRRYRLPTDAEWASAAGNAVYPWGNQWPPPNNAGNYAGQEMRGMTAAEREPLKSISEIGGGFPLIAHFSDGFKFTAPVGSYAANSLGIQDLGGNVSEWCEDKHPDLAPARVRRGSHWMDADGDTCSTRRPMRSSFVPTAPDDIGTTGFRCVLEQ